MRTPLTHDRHGDNGRPDPRPRAPHRRSTTAAVVVGLLAAGCGTTDGATTSDAPTDATTPGATAATTAPTTPEPVTVTLLTHDSFNLTESLLTDFEAATGIHIEVLRAGDAGAMVNQAVLTRDAPLADVLFGVDTTFLSRALDAELFLPYTSPTVTSGLLVDEVGPAIDGAVPVDVGHVCVNLDRLAYDESGVTPPVTLDDLADPAHADRLVVENPATSSPGLAFLLTTVAAFGEDGWLDYWQRLVDNGVAVAAGWEEAYYGQFSGGAGEGDRPLVVSYSSSPPAEVMFGPDPEADVAPTGVMLDTCFQQVEYAGILYGTEHPEAAGQVVEFLLSPQVQADVPTSMFVFPARRDVTLPEVFTKFAEVPSAPWSVSPADIEANREAWIEAWTDVVLR